MTASALLLGGCAGTTTEKDDDVFHVAIANYAEDIPLYRSIHERADEVAESDPSTKLSWYNNDSDPATMLNNVRLMIQSRPDAIVLLPVSQATEGVSQLLEESGIPCVSINLETPACSFLNIDNALLGTETAEVVAAEALERGWNASNTVVLLGQVAASGEQVNDCVRYFYSVLADEIGLEPATPQDITPTTTRIGENGIQFDSEESLEASYQAVTNLISTIPEDKNIILYTANSDATRGALRALEDRGRADADRVLIGGLSGDSVSLDALEEDPRWVAEGDIFIDYWGVYGIAMAQAMVEGDEVSPPDLTPLPQVVFSKAAIEEMRAVHPQSDSLSALPPLVAGNEYLGTSSFLKSTKLLASS